MEAPLDWTPLQPFGARIDIDLSQPLSQARADAMRRLFDEHHLLLFRGQNLDQDRQNQVSALFGVVERPDHESFLAADPDIGGLGMSELAFHSDLSCASEPVEGISLYAIDVDEAAPPTMFVDAVNAAATLGDALRARIADLHVVNLWPMSLDVRQRRENSPDDWPGAVHPLLKPHPRTGDTILYINASHSDRIVELPPAESEEVVQALFAHLYHASPRLRHHWRNGDFVVWDNLALQHARDPIPDGFSRTLRRVEIGPRSYVSEMPRLLYS